MTSFGDTAFWILTSLAGGRKHGYAILRDVESAAGSAPRVTTLYAGLERLEQQGLVRADGDEIVDGRARRYFVVTDTGLERLQHETVELESRARAARAALGRATATRPRLTRTAGSWA